MFRRTVATRFQTQYIASEAGNGFNHTMDQCKVGVNQTNALFAVVLAVSAVYYIAAIPNTARNGCHERGAPFYLAAPAIGHGNTKQKEIASAGERTF